MIFIVFTFVVIVLLVLYETDIHILFTVVLNEAPGAKIVREWNLVLYKHFYMEKLDAIEFWMEDDNGNRIDNHGETVAFTLHMKKNS